MLMQQPCWANVLVFFTFAACHCCLLLTSRFRSCATPNSNVHPNLLKHKQTPLYFVFIPFCNFFSPINTQRQPIFAGADINKTFMFLSEQPWNRAKSEACVVVVIRCCVLFSMVILQSELLHEYARYGVTLFLFCVEARIACGLSDTYVHLGKPAEFKVKMNKDCDGAWFKDGEQVKPHSHNWPKNMSMPLR